MNKEALKNLVSLFDLADSQIVYDDGDLRVNNNEFYASFKAGFGSAKVGLNSKMLKVIANFDGDVNISDDKILLKKKGVRLKFKPLEFENIDFIQKFKDHKNYKLQDIDFETFQEIVSRVKVDYFREILPVVFQDETVFSGDMYVAVFGKTSLKIDGIIPLSVLNVVVKMKPIYFSFDDDFVYMAGEDWILYHRNSRDFEVKNYSSILDGLKRQKSTKFKFDCSNISILNSIVFDDTLNFFRFDISKGKAILHYESELGNGVVSLGRVESEYENSFNVLTDKVDVFCGSGKLAVSDDKRVALIANKKFKYLVALAVLEVGDES